MGVVHMEKSYSALGDPSALMVQVGVRSSPPTTLIRKDVGYEMKELPGKGRFQEQRLEDVEKEDLPDAKAAVEEVQQPLVINVVTTSGEKGVRTFEDTSRGLILSGINLSAITMSRAVGTVASSLREVSFAANKLAAVDLSPLANCENLEAIMLNGNRLQSIDLAPLSRCTKLQRLWLHNNSIAEIDLTPMANFPALQSLCLENNRIKGRLNLGPLSRCRVLRSLRLGGNELGGTLDVTPLLLCKTLSAFDASPSVRILAYTGNTTGVAPALPPALRKRHFSVEWKSTGDVGRKESRPREKVAKGVSALAIGFQSRHFMSMSLLLASSGQLDMDNMSDSTCIDSTLLDKYGIIVVHPTAENKVQEVRISNPKIPIVVVGSSATYADAASRCLRKGAKCFMPEPLTDRSAISIRSLAQQYMRSFSPRLRPQKDPEPTESPIKGPARTEISFEKLRLDYAAKNGLVAESPRHRLEESALTMLAQRRNGKLNRDDFTSVATLCGLPACSVDALFDAVRPYDGAEILDEGLGTPEGKISKDTLIRYWRERMKRYDAETRLFHVLSSGTSQRVSTEQLMGVAGKLLRSRAGGFALLRSALKDARVNELHEEVAVAIIFYGISGSMTPLRASQTRKVELCKLLHAAESGMFNGLAANLRPDRFQKIVSAVEKCSRGSSISCADLVYFSAEGRLVVPAAVRRLFACHCDKSGNLPIKEFVRFFMATTDPSTESAVKYLFPALDVDMDGFISAQDLAVMYREKKHDVEFGILWSSVHDLLSGSNKPAQPDRVSAANILALAAKDRAMLLRTLMYIDDDIEVDISRTSA